MLASSSQCPPQIMRRLTKELSELQREPLEGVSVQLNDANITDIRAVITGPNGTPFADGQFKIRLVIPDDFPNVPPKGHFLTTVFHPNVATPSGEICVNTLKKDWKPELGIRHILLTIKCLLIAPNPESALNEEAGKLLLEDYAAYEHRARMMTEVHAIPGGGRRIAPLLQRQQQDGPQTNADNQDAIAMAKKHKDRKKALRRL